MTDDSTSAEFISLRGVPTITEINHKQIKMLKRNLFTNTEDNWPWRWHSTQHPLLVLQQSEFESWWLIINCTVQEKTKI